MHRLGTLVFFVSVLITFPTALVADEIQQEEISSEEEALSVESTVVNLDEPKPEISQRERGALNEVTRKKLRRIRNNAIFDAVTTTAITTALYFTQKDPVTKQKPYLCPFGKMQSLAIVLALTTASLAHYAEKSDSKKGAKAAGISGFIEGISTGVARTLGMAHVIAVPKGHANIQTADIKLAFRKHPVRMSSFVAFLFGMAGFGAMQTKDAYQLLSSLKQDEK